jgi:PTS system glucose-specific IIA component
MKDVVILSPFTGRVVRIEDVPDPVFAEKMVGDGLAVDPAEGVGCAPTAGQIQLFHRSGHALAVKTHDDVAVLLHVGLDTVGMKGEGFERLAEEGDPVTAGQPLVRFDLDAIRRAGHSPISPVILPDLPDGFEIEKTTSVHVRAGEDVLLTVRRRE